MRPNVQGPPASSQIKQYDLVNYQIIVKPNFSQQTNLQRCSMRPWWCFQSLKHIWYLPVYSVSAPSPPEYIKLTTGTSLRKAIFLFLSCGQLPVSDRWAFNKTFKNYPKSRLKFFWSVDLGQDISEMKINGFLPFARLEISDRMPLDKI